MFDVCIIGKGPSGISAALYTLRAGLTTLIIGKDFGALGKAANIDNYYGVNSVSGKELAETGAKQARKLGAEIIDDEVVSISYGSCFEVETIAHKIECKALLLATGSSRKAPLIKGLKDFEGRGVSYCAVCDGFFYRGKNVAVLGSGSYAMSECSHLLALANSVTVLTNGQQAGANIPEGVMVDKRKIKSVIGDEYVNGVTFDDQSFMPVDGVFVAIGTASSVDFARKLGAIVEDNKIKVEKDFSTNIPGLYAAGDCVSEVMQVSVAVGQGAIAGLSIINFIRKLEEK
jgi:thioredoxin-disulfide reductase